MADFKNFMVKVFRDENELKGSALPVWTPGLGCFLHCATLRAVSNACCATSNPHDLATIRVASREPAPTARFAARRSELERNANTDCFHDKSFSGPASATARRSRWPESRGACFDTQRHAQICHACVDLLAPRAGKIFMMREFLGFESEEICLQRGLTTSNLHVILHRSRLKLRGCLENGWINPGAGAC